MRHRGRERVRTRAAAHRRAGRRVSGRPQRQDQHGGSSRTRAAHEDAEAAGAARAGGARSARRAPHSVSAVASG
eukprot:4763091-Prymnesium_polylepis.1